MIFSCENIVFCIRYEFGCSERTIVFFIIFLIFKVRLLSELDYDTILKGIKPSKQEHEGVMKLSGDLVNLINETASDLGVEVEAALVGSVSKVTWLS